MDSPFFSSGSNILDAKPSPENASALINTWEVIGTELPRYTPKKPSSFTVSLNVCQAEVYFKGNDCILTLTISKGTPKIVPSDPATPPATISSATVNLSMN